MVLSTSGRDRAGLACVKIISFHLVGGLIPGGGLLLWAGLLPNQPGALLITGETRGSGHCMQPLRDAAIAYGRAQGASGQRRPPLLTSTTAMINESFRSG